MYKDYLVLGCSSTAVTVLHYLVLSKFYLALGSSGTVVKVLPEPDDPDEAFIVSKWRISFGLEFGDGVSFAELEICASPSPVDRRRL